MGSNSSSDFYQAELWAPEDAPVQRPASAFSMRDYQLMAHDSIFECWVDKSSTLLHLATGLGKTVVSGEVARSVVADHGRFLWMVHRETLATQAVKAFSEICPRAKVGVEMSDSRAQLTGPWAADIVVASKDSISQKRRLERYPKDYFTKIGVDEAHHYIEANSTYERPISYFEKSELLGVTATITRADGKKLGSKFKSMAMSYGIVPGIRDGWLVPIVQEFVTVSGYDTSKVSVTGSGDFDPAELAAIMEQEKTCHALASAAIKYSNYKNQYSDRRQTLIFAASIDHSKKVAEILNRHNRQNGTGAAASIDSRTNKPDEVRAIINSYLRKEIRYLCNYGILTEGFDAPETQIVVIGRPTPNASLYAQMVGRGTRPLTEIVPFLNASGTPDARRELIRRSRKPSCMIVDLVGVSRLKIEGQATVADLMQDEYSDEEIERAKFNIMQQGGRGIIDAELLKAREQLASEAMAKRASIIVEVELQSSAVDPLGVTGVSEQKMAGFFSGRPATDPQKNLLTERLGVNRAEAEKLTRGRAQSLITALIERERKGLANYGQSKVLRALGKDPRDVTFQEAKKILEDHERQRRG